MGQQFLAYLQQCHWPWIRCVHMEYSFYICPFPCAVWPHSTSLATLGPTRRCSSTCWLGSWQPAPSCVLPSGYSCFHPGQGEEGACMALMECQETVKVWLMCGEVYHRCGLPKHKPGGRARGGAFTFLTGKITAYCCSSM